MTDPEKLSSEYQTKFFDHLGKFFHRATGCAPEKFATAETFSEVVRREATSLARRIPETYAWADRQIRALQAREGLDVFTAARNLGGLKLVLGGSSRFLDTHLEAVKSSLLYADTILIPDPIMPWLETPREEERFRHVNFLQAAFFLLHLKPIVDARLPYPAILVFPSWEKTLEEKDPYTKEALLQLITDVLAFYVNREFERFDDVLRFIHDHPDDFLAAVEAKSLFVPPGGQPGESLEHALTRYRQELSTWRSAEWLDPFSRLPPAKAVLNGIMERLSPQYHLLENADELGSHPLLCVEQQAYYYGLVAETASQRLVHLQLLDKGTRTLLEALSSQRLKWLSNVPMEALVDLRSRNENSVFRQRLSSCINKLHESTLEEIDKVVNEVCHDISVIIAEHDMQLADIQSRYKRVYGQTAVAAWAAFTALIIPTLAPFIGTTAPFALATKYAWDKIGELSEKRKLSKSLTGVLARAKQMFP